MTQSTIGSVMCAWLILAAPPLQETARPNALVCPAFGVGQLQRTPTQYITYSYSTFSHSPGQGDIEFVVYRRERPGIAWNEGVSHHEAVDFDLTAVAPLHSGSWNTLYAIGVLEDGQTVIEQWTADVAVGADGKLSITVAKRPLFASKDLTHIQAAAAAPNGRFLVVPRHENHDLLRVDLPSGKTTVLATTLRYPNLDSYNVIVWQRHEREGHVFRVVEGRDCVVTHTGSLLVWDADLDGSPEQIEDVSKKEFEARGYDDASVWEPNRSLYRFD